MKTVSPKELSVSELKIRRNMMFLLTAFLVYTLAGGEFSGAAKIQPISMELKTPEKLIYLLWMSLVYYLWQFRMIIGDHWGDFDIETKNMLMKDETFKNIFIKHVKRTRSDSPKRDATENFEISRRVFWYRLKHRSQTGNGFRYPFILCLPIYKKDFWWVLKIDISNIMKIWINKKYACDYYFPYLYLFVVAIYMLFSRVKLF